MIAHPAPTFIFNRVIWRISLIVLLPSLSFFCNVLKFHERRTAQTRCCFILILGETFTYQIRIEFVEKPATVIDAQLASLITLIRYNNQLL